MVSIMESVSIQLCRIWIKQLPMTVPLTLSNI